MQKTLNYILSLLSILYLSLVYFNFAYTNMAMLLLIVVFIYGVVFKNISLKINKEFIKNYSLISIPFLLTIISVIISKEKVIGLSYIVFRLPILLVPFIILLVFETKRSLKNIVFIYIFTSVIALFITLINISKLNFNNSFIDIIMSNKSTIIQHPYFGVFQLLALIFLLEFFKDRINKYGFYLLFIIFSLGILISTSRISYLLYFIIISLYVLKNLSVKKSALIIAILSLTFLTIITTNKQLQYKFTRSFNIETSPRLKIWKNSFLVLKKADFPLFGVGIGDYYQKGKKDAYWLKGILLELKNDYNGLNGYDSHSMYIEFILLNGVIGLFYTFLMLYLLFKSLKEKDIFKISIVLILVFFSVTESILNRQYGLTLYCFLMPIIFSLKINKNK